jgi:hypothetical protein
VPGGVAFMVAPTGERLELLAVDVQPSAWDDPIAAGSVRGCAGWARPGGRRGDWAPPP